jgi:membrane protease YdiL (CAAX protease family)
MNVVEIIKEIGESLTTTDAIVCLPGVVLLAIWLVGTSFGSKALAGSPPRRNNMPAYLPFVPLFVGIGLVSLAIAAKEVFLTDLHRWQSVYLDNLILCLGAMAAILLIMVLARGHFARRLKGFGLTGRAIHKDLLAAVANLTAAYPLVTFALVVTLFVGKLISGPDFELGKHDQLKLVTEHSQLSVRVLIVFVTVVVMPIFEEMLFRGMFQSMLRSYLSSFESRVPGFFRRHSAWLAIGLTSGLFAAVHGNAGHWPALFVLAMCMGYSYEKSGSLFRPIFIHSLFNAVSVMIALQNT